MTTHLCDVNVWFSLAIVSHTHHPEARRWYDAIREPDTMRFCRSTEQSLLRLLTTRSVVAPYRPDPLTNEEAWGVYDSFLRDDRVAATYDEPAGIAALWHEYAVRPTASPKLWMDAYLAAFARALDWRLVTTDRAFRQFEGLDVLVLGEDAG